MPHPGLIEWIAKQHDGQLIKRTNEPYLNHLLRVADMSGQFVSLGYECGLCHDIFEKTKVTPQVLRYYLLHSGYTENEAEIVVAVAIELTDVYTKSAYSNLKKAVRKQKEEQRLITVGPVAQTVKYADLYDNIIWMLQFDGSKTGPYLRRKKDLLNNMAAGNPILREQVIYLIDKSKNELSS